MAGITPEEFEREIREGLREDMQQDLDQFAAQHGHRARTKLTKAIKARNVESEITPTEPE